MPPATLTSPKEEGSDTQGRFVLLVEDDRALATMIVEFLEQQGLVVQSESRGDRAVQRILSQQPDLVVLDLTLPGMDGLDVCRHVRENGRESYQGPILMLTARGRESDEITGLDRGADDYIAKPVKPGVLLARVRALLRRRLTPPAPDALGPTTVGTLTMDPKTRTASVSGEGLALSPAEFAILWELVKSEGSPLSRRVLLDRLRRIDYDPIDRSIDLRISRLRQKLGALARPPGELNTVRNIGYVYERNGAGKKNEKSLG